MTTIGHQPISDADADELLRAADITDAERRSLLAALIATRGDALVATAVHTPGDVDRGSLIAAVLDDRAFLLDTLLAAIRRSGQTVRAVQHPVVALPDARPPVAAMVIELEARLEPEALVPLEDRVRRVLLAATAVVDERAAGSANVAALAAATDTDPEVAALLRWLLDDRGVLLATGHYTLRPGGADGPTGGTGLLAPHASDGGARAWTGPLAGGGTLEIEPPEPASVAQITGGAPIVAGHMSRRSPVHRSVRMQELLLPEHDDAGTLSGFLRVLYLLTHRAEAEPASEVPVLRARLDAALDAADLRADSHDHKHMVALYDAMPKDELLAITAPELVELLGALMNLAPDEALLRSRPHGDGRTASIVVAIPRDRYSPNLRDQMQTLIGERYGTTDVVAHEVIGDEAHVQLHVVVHDDHGLRRIDAGELTTAVLALARTWLTALRDELVVRAGYEQGRLLAAHWGPRLPEQYRASVAPEHAVGDVLALEQLRRSGEATHVALRPEEGANGSVTRVALLSRQTKAELSRVIRILEDLGLTVLEERPTRVSGGGDELWIQDFGVTGPGGGPLDLDVCGERVAACIMAVWNGSAESDRLHRLIVTTELDHQRLEVLRAYRRYRARIGSRYTESFQNQVIAAHPHTTAALVRLFELRFDPSIERDPHAEAALRSEIVRQIDAVSSLDDDRILRNQLGLIDATVRTNAYVPGRRTLAIKLRAADIPALPQPAPLWEVYVYAPHVEGVHLRGGAIARGGLRWSDREDFRTEVFGLMRAQMVKNAVIVPAGAKGGFRLRQPPSDPAQLRASVEAAYVDYIDALLDLTDSRDGEQIVGPPQVVRRDGDDPYLVVAADKGTATFSDTANAVARRRGFWLDDAFASGGSHGYDHKALGITARGAWESVRRHFRERGIDPERDPITVVGIGDMSGDVFGNGLLRSRTIRLVGAYDHRHLFIDPNPGDPHAAFAERQRLFDLPRSSWDDYDRALISDGGGVWPRTAKSIPISPQIRDVLGITDEQLPPTELIRALLRADVDLLWNGGIGTVVKASTETDADAQDRSCDAIRVNGNELRCRVVGEGGNLGFTQRARIEFARGGGAINADFIDNSAGVDCSDHEVNLKILLGEAIRRGQLDLPGRDALLVEATDEVCAHVLADSARQARSLTEEELRSPSRMAAYEELMVALEEHQLLRADHDLPTSEQMGERTASGEGMSRPELAVLLSLAKLAITGELLDSPLVDDRALEGDLLAYFPQAITARFAELAWEHPLRRELLATLVANDVVDTMGQSFVFRRAVEFGASASAVVRAFLIARDVCDAPRLIAEIEAMTVSPAVRWSMTAVVQDAVRQVSRWYLRNDVTADADLRDTIAHHRAAARALVERVEADVVRGLGGDTLAGWHAGGAPSALADEVACCRLLPLAPYLADISARTARSIQELTVAVEALREALPLDTLQGLIANLPAATRVARWANQALRDDYLAAVARLAGLALTDGIGPARAVQHGVERRNAGVRRLQQLVREAQMAKHNEVAGTTLAVRQLRELADWFTRRQVRPPAARDH
ncbi:MAG: NAD-glutamate dehydrogenase [Patulibacter sp.]